MKKTIEDWNVVVTVFEEGYRHALRALKQLGPVANSPYHNVLVMAAENPVAVLDALEARITEDPGLYDAISRVAPARRCFCYHSAEEFVEKAAHIVLDWAPQLANRSFHVRLRRRGFRHDIISPEAERALDGAILGALEEAGTPGRIAFDDPDAVIAIDTIDERAGMALWTRDDLKTHKLLRPD